MNDPQIRKAFHETILLKHHQQPTTLVIDELGLEHGRCRADIAVVNGHLIGYEIKSDVDSLKRLSSQINVYNAIFDNSSVILTERHLEEALRIVPDWWGIILVKGVAESSLKFRHLRYPHQNININNYSVAQLLWREEAQEILMSLGIRGARLKERRANLYRYIVEMLEAEELRFIVRERLKLRQAWRHPSQLSLYDG
jgi:hypothetical protein